MAFPAWLFPPVKGGLFTGHLTTLHWTDQGTRCKLHGFDMEVEITTKFPLQVHLTCYGLKVDAAAETVMHVSSDTQCCECPMQHHPERTVVELCAGVGGIGLGALTCRFKILAQVDSNWLSVEHLRQMGHGLTIHGDITDDATLHAIHVACPDQIGILAAGFNCQPFSVQGDMRGLFDNRASSFSGAPKTLSPDPVDIGSIFQEKQPPKPWFGDLHRCCCFMSNFGSVCIITVISCYIYI